LWNICEDIYTFVARYFDMTTQERTACHSDSTARFLNSSQSFVVPSNARNLIFFCHFDRSGEI